MYFVGVSHHHESPPGGGKRPHLPAPSLYHWRGKGQARTIAGLAYRATSSARITAIVLGSCRQLNSLGTYGTMKPLPGAITMQQLMITSPAQPGASLDWTVIMQTFKNWEGIAVSGQTGSVKNGDAKFFKYRTPVPTTKALDDLADGLGTLADDGTIVPATLDAKRMLGLVYAQLKIVNRPNPCAKAPKRKNAQEALATQLSLAKQYIGSGMDVDEALERASNEAAASPPTAVEVDWITREDSGDKLGKESLDAAEKELLKRIS